MIFRQVSVEKKVGLPDFSSVTLGLVSELEEKDTVDAAVDHVVKILDQKIAEIAEHPPVPHLRVRVTEPGKEEKENPGETHQPKGRHGNNGDPTPKQLAYARRLSKERGVKVTLKGLTRAEVSELIDDLLKA